VDLEVGDGEADVGRLVSELGFWIRQYLNIVRVRNLKVLLFQMEMEVRRVGKQDCFVSLPGSLLEVLLSSRELPSFPVVLELRLTTSSVRGGRSGGSVGDGTWFLAWDGSASRSSQVEVLIQAQPADDLILLAIAHRIRSRSVIPLCFSRDIMRWSSEERSFETLILCNSLVLRGKKL
jgi:hypothetical protein